MILLDTYVVSAPMTREPHSGVRAWLDALATETLFLSSITVASRETSAFDAAGLTVIDPWSVTN
jgi:predicted nucleic acid-binding protein